MCESELLVKIEYAKDAIDEAREGIELADGQAYYKQKQLVEEKIKALLVLEFELKVLRGEAKEPTTPAGKLYSKVKERREYEKAVIEQNKQDLQKWIDAETLKRCNAYINRFKGKRGRNALKTNVFYLKKCDYETGKQLKMENDELRWDPYVKRWFAQVPLWNGQSYDPGGLIKEYLLEPHKNALAMDWSYKIKFEIENLPPYKRELTYRVHKTYTPRFVK